MDIKEECDHRGGAKTNGTGGLEEDAKEGLQAELIHAAGIIKKKTRRRGERNEVKGGHNWTQVFVLVRPKVERMGACVTGNASPTDAGPGQNKKQQKSIKLTCARFIGYRRTLKGGKKKERGAGIAGKSPQCGEKEVF